MDYVLDIADLKEHLVEDLAPILMQWVYFQYQYQKACVSFCVVLLRYSLHLIFLTKRNYIHSISYIGDPSARVFGIEPS